MKKLFLIALTGGVALMLATASFSSSRDGRVVIGAGPGLAVVELFTSEGCSSCPPADRVLADLDRAARTGGRNVFLLSFHVDYWNRLGWKDPYSSPDFSRRQGEYAEKFGRNGVYTPQMIINGVTEFVGSDRDRAVGEIAAALRKPFTESMAISVTDSDAAGVSVRFALLDARPGSLLHFALVDDERTTQVGRGENGGRFLRHVNVVRSFRTITTDARTEGSARLPRPADSRGSRVIAYLQSPTTYEITAVGAAGL